MAAAGTERMHVGSVTCKSHMMMLMLQEAWRGPYIKAVNRDDKGAQVQLVLSL